ncbi:MAG TPA: PAS domain-containing protein [Armatimonadota bacterium]|jgi:PAS domain S-box-containing protein
MNKTLWELLWDYDPNGLLVVDAGMVIRVVNPALCAMFKATADELIGHDAAEFMDDLSDFRSVWESNSAMAAEEREYPRFDLYVRQVIFPITDEGIVACIMIDLTHERRQEHEMRELKRQALRNVTRVVDNQMKVAQEIAGLLGETTAETKVSLLKVIEMLDEGVV